MKRLFIEIDKINKHNEWELESSLDTAQELVDYNGKEPFFWKVVDNARWEPNLFEYIKEADEIHMSTSIVPLVTYTSIGSPALWNSMMQLAIEQKLKNKSVFIQRKFSDIEWGNLDQKLLNNAFKYNFLFTVNDDYLGWEQVDIDRLLRSLKKRHK